MPSANQLVRLTAIVAEADTDVAVAEGCGLTGGGCRVADPDPDRGRVVIDYWVPAASNPGADALRQVLWSVGVVAPVSEQVESDAWRNALRDFHQPVVVGRIRVRPPWVPPAAGMLDVVIDPGMAFGTGQHPTTRTSLELISEVPRGAVLDAGCGTGVLAIAAARLGFGPITAIDHDPHAVRATEGGARANMVDIDAHQMRIGHDPLPYAPIVFANLTLEVLTLLASALHATSTDGDRPRVGTDPGQGLSPPGVQHLVASGLRVDEVDAAVDAFSPLGLRGVRRIDEDGWASVRLAR